MERYRIGFTATVTTTMTQMLPHAVTRLNVAVRQTVRAFL